MESPAKCMWKPNPRNTTRQDCFRKAVAKKYGVQLENYQDLYRWSVDNYAKFWEEVWYFTDVKYSKLHEEVIDKSANICELPAWFGGSQLNYAENLLRHNSNKIAIYTAAEGRAGVTSHTFAEVRRAVAEYAQAMRKLGIQRGDRVVGYLPNCIEAVIAMLATSSIGAVWSTTSPDFGVTGVLDRFRQIQPKLMFSVNAVIYNNKYHNHMERLQQVVASLPDLIKVVVIEYTIRDGEKVDISDIRDSCFLGEFLHWGHRGDGAPFALRFEQVPFGHPLYVMYSSGTTGVPKCMVHSVGGTLLKHLEEHILQGNMIESDILLYSTNTGWMMWNWQVSALATGAAIVLYDGSTFVPTANIMWDIIDEVGVTVFGTSAKWLAIINEMGVQPGTSHSLKTLHSILSTGSPLKPDTFDYVYERIKSDLLLGSITGGTDIIACFAGENWNVPVYRGEIQCRLLGMAVECWDAHGQSKLGEKGELVCTKPFPSMPTHFWNDPDGLKYKKAYFTKFPGVWAHGDYCLINPETGGVWMLGRSDGTLNPSGVRFGSAEIYNVVDRFAEVKDSLCVSQRSRDGSEERVVLFLQMAPHVEFAEDLVARIRRSIRSELSARHVPAVVLSTAEIPYTHNGKKVEVAVKRVIAGEEVSVRGAYCNPDSLDLYRNISALQGY